MYMKNVNSVRMKSRSYVFRVASIIGDVIVSPLLKLLLLLLIPEALLQGNDLVDGNL